MYSIVAHLRTVFAEEANVRKAAEMQAYMKTNQPFYGIQTPERRKILRQSLKLHPIETQSGWKAVILELWNGKYREKMYAAMDIAGRFNKYRTPEVWPLFVQLAESATNWDTLDYIASNLLGELVLNNREFETEVKSWRTSENMWIRRATILVHLKHKTETNLPLLAETILKLAHEEEFFIRKAIGWVLREYAKTDPDWVLNFIAKHDAQLSPLSKREAVKNISS